MLYRTKAGRFTTRKTSRPVKRSNYVPVYLNDKGWYGRKVKGSRAAYSRPGAETLKRRAGAAKAARARAAKKGAATRAKKRKNPTAMTFANVAKRDRFGRFKPAGRRSNPRSSAPAKRGGRTAAAAAYRKRNPAREPGVFGLKGVTQWPVIGKLLERDNFWMGTGVALSLGTTAPLSRWILQATGIAPSTPKNGTAKKGAEWYTKKDAKGNDSWAKTSVDAAIPITIGALSATSAAFIQNPAGKAFLKGAALGSIGWGIGIILARALYPMLPEAMRPEATVAIPVPSAKGTSGRRSSVRDYLQAGDRVSGGRRGTRDYLQEGDLARIKGGRRGAGAGGRRGAGWSRRGTNDYLQEGDLSRIKGGMNYGLETDVSTRVMEERTF